MPGLVGRCWCAGCAGMEMEPWRTFEPERAWPAPGGGPVADGRVKLLRFDAGEPCIAGLALRGNGMYG